MNEAAIAASRAWGFGEIKQAYKDGDNKRADDIVAEAVGRGTEDLEETKANVAVKRG